MTYSPTIDPSKLKNFIYSKFKIKDSELNLNIELAETSLSYAQWISKFLCRIYENSSQVLSPFYEQLSMQNNLNPSSAYLSDSLIKCAIKRLLDYSKFEDAIIINLMYNLAISPRIIYYLQFNNLTPQLNLK